MMRFLGRKLAIVMAGCEILIVTLYAIYVRFDHVAMPTLKAKSFSGITYASKWLKYRYT